MADLSKPAEAVEWAASWLRDEALGPLAFVRRPPGSAKRRIEAAIVDLQRDPIQAQRCARSIAALRGMIGAL